MVLRAIYCALEGVSLPEDVPVTINTLEDVLFKDRMNDISFEIGGKLVILIEHQSTVNPNMALRLLMYVARVYEKIVEGKSIFTSKKIPIPRPEFSCRVRRVHRQGEGVREGNRGFKGSDGEGGDLLP
jgi:hypothetical protein